MAQNTVKTECVVIGGSAGSLQIIARILANINPSLPFPIVVVMHRKEDFNSNLEGVLAHQSSIPVTEAADKEPLLAGHAYLAPAGYHLLIEKNMTFSLDGSEKINYSRPSIDVTLETAADTFGSALVAVLLSGANQDGRNGFRMIKRLNGRLVVQDPAEAVVETMPQSVITEGLYDHIFSVNQMIDYINDAAYT